MSTTPAQDAIGRSLAAIARHEPTVRAFAYMGEAEARQRARRIDAAAGGALRGLTVGVKDLIDTADMPTTYGSPLYAGHRPRADAAVVSMIEHAGGCLLGKTVTTEFAGPTPGPTTNPHRRSHTPGGSSSGSAAAVAAGLVDIGVGTQTYGSLIRPASFCGVFGFKPTRGVVPVDGVRPLAEAFDTIGWMARDLDLVERVLVALTGTGKGERSDGGELRVGTVHAGRAGSLAEAVRSLPGVCDAAPVAPVDVTPVDLEAALEEITRWHGVIGDYQIGRNLVAEYARGGLSAPLRELVERCRTITDDAAEHAAAELATRAAKVLDVFAAVDVIAGPATTGEAPRGLASTGDARHCTPWSALGCPALTVPAARGSTGLPIGVQLVAAPGRDADLLRAARALFAGLTSPPVAGD